MEQRQRGGVAWATGLGAAALTFSCAAIIGIEDRMADLDGSPAPCVGGAQCVPVPAGWKLVALGAPSACSPGYANRSEIQLAPDECDCACNEVSSGSCGSGTVTVREFTESDCNANNVRSVPLDGGDGGCTAQPYDFSDTGYARFGNSSVVFAPADCGDGGGTARPKPREEARTCTPAADACGASSVCAPPIGDTERLCVETATRDAACPTEFPVRIAAGTSPGADTRACGSCTCGSTSTTECGTAGIDLYGTRDCSGEKVALRVGACSAFDASAGSENPRVFQSYVMTWPKAPRCVPTSPVHVVTGNVTFQSGVTLCCAARADAGDGG